MHFIANNCQSRIDWAHNYYHLLILPNHKNLTVRIKQALRLYKPR